MVSASLPTSGEFMVGSRNRVLTALNRVGEDAAEAIFRSAIARATEGDQQAAAQILSRAWPARKGRAVESDLSPLMNASDLPVALGAIVSAMDRGDMSAEEASAIAAVLDVHRRAIETNDLEVLLEALEQARGRQAMSARNLARRVRALERAAQERSGVRALTRPADVKGEVLAEWEAKYLHVPHDAALIVNIKRFGEGPGTMERAASRCDQPR